MITDLINDALDTKPIQLVRQVVTPQKREASPVQLTQSFRDDIWQVKLQRVLRVFKEASDLAGRFDRDMQELLDS